MGTSVMVVVVVLALVVVGTVVWRRYLTSSPATAASPSGTPLDTSRFAPGACMAYSPTSGNRHQTVFLDAGHGGVDPGGVGTTESGDQVTEAQETLPVELDTMALLRADGFRVVVSRTRPSTVTRLTSSDVAGGAFTVEGSHNDVAARDVCANLAGANVLVGIYFDAGAASSDAGGLTAYDPARSFAAKSHRLASLVQGDVLSAMNAQGWQIPDQGVVTDTELGSYVASPGSSLANKALSYNHIMLIGPAESGYFSTPSQMPGVVTEPLFITDPFEASIAASAHGQQVMAHGLAKAIEQYFSGSSTSSS